MENRIQKSHGCKRLTLAAVIMSSAIAGLSHASSHREAPMIAGMPRLDATDLYMFRSYEEGRDDYVTIMANYFPLQAAYGGPNYFDLETAGHYQIHIDNDGDSVEDMTFTFDFSTILAGAGVPVGGSDVPIPLINAGGIGPGTMDTGAVNSRQEYTVTLTRTTGEGEQSDPVRNADTDATTFRKPVDNIGTKSIPDYGTYADNHIYAIAIPGCSTDGRLFVGQRNEGFAVNLGQVFDLVNLNPLGAEDAVPNPIGDTSITSMALEIPVDCLTENDPVIGAWTTASLDMGDEPPLQVSRLGFPLVNELVIGLPDKDTFNASHPANDGQFVNYVLNPTLPFLLETLFGGAGAVAPDVPRNDLVLALGGVPELNTPQNIANGTYGRSEMLRLNTSIDPVAAPEQDNMGVIGGDTAGFPNGRRPGDDVVDVALRVMMGALISDPNVAPNNDVPFTDQTTVSAVDFRTTFPYLNEPLPGSQLPGN